MDELHTLYGDVIGIALSEALRFSFWSALSLSQCRLSLSRPKLQNPNNATEAPWGRHMAQLVILKCCLSRKSQKENKSPREGTRKHKLAVAAESGKYVPKPWTSKYITASRPTWKPQNPHKTWSLIQLWTHALHPLMRPRLKVGCGRWDLQC